jgi:peptide chain release factor 2
MRSETLGLIEQIRKSLTLLGQRMDIETAAHRLEEFDAMTEDPELWNDPTRAQALMRDRRMLSDAIETHRAISQELEDQIGLIELGEAEGDSDVVEEAEEELRKLAKSAGEKELEALLNGEADSNDTFLEINAGAGGTESCDWASMLARMYVRWAEKKGYTVELMSESAGDEAGIRANLYRNPQTLLPQADFFMQAPLAAFSGNQLFESAAGKLIGDHRLQALVRVVGLVGLVVNLPAVIPQLVGKMPHSA